MPARRHAAGRTDEPSSGRSQRKTHPCGVPVVCSFFVESAYILGSRSEPIPQRGPTSPYSRLLIPLQLKSASSLSMLLSTGINASQSRLEPPQKLARKLRKVLLQPGGHRFLLLKNALADALGLHIASFIRSGDQDFVGKQSPCARSCSPPGLP